MLRGDPVYRIYRLANVATVGVVFDPVVVWP